MSLWRVCVLSGGGEEKGKSSSSLWKLGLVSNTSMLIDTGQVPRSAAARGKGGCAQGEWAQGGRFLLTVHVELTESSDRGLADFEKELNFKT